MDKPRPKTIKNVIIADDQNLFANGLKQLLEEEGDIKITAIIDRGDKVSTELSNIKPDVLLLDINMPGKNGIKVLEEIRPKFPDLIIAILSTYNDRILIEKAEKLGANAYLSKDATIEELREVIFNTHKFKYYLSEEIKLTPRRKTIDIDNFAQSIFITNREKEILKLISKGQTSKKIAESLNISQSTVKTHRKNLFKKIEVTNVSELLKYAYENKII